MYHREGNTAPETLRGAAREPVDSSHQLEDDPQNGSFIFAFDRIPLAGILIPPCGGSNPPAPARQSGLRGIISGLARTADIPAG
jgi:hypothetical protein